MTSHYFTPMALRWLEGVLHERFDQEFNLNQQADTLVLTLPGSDQSIIFAPLQSVFHQSRSDFSCQYWNPTAEGFEVPIAEKLPAPSESELPSPLVEFNGNYAFIHYDILGLTYWMLSRLEEVGRKDLDSHLRFPATSSHAFQYGYLERPIVDEWLIVLGQVMQRVWPQIGLRQHRFRIKVSHDVDTPSLYGFKSWATIGRMMAGHLLKHQDLRAFLTSLYVKLGTNTQLNPADPFNTFDWLMDVSEANNLQSAFYFICGRTDPVRDADYEPEDLVIRNLMSRIHERNHEIGLHPSYGTFQNPALIKWEADRLKHICAEENIKQTEWGGRMHYLRWEQPGTLRALDAAGMNYDSTLGYADKPGFRAGTCHEFQAFDPVAQKQLTLRIRPLVVMECTVIDPIYLGLGISEEAVEKMKCLRENCRQVGGTFSLLWHNSYFRVEGLKSMYENVLRP